MDSLFISKDKNNRPSWSVIVTVITSIAIIAIYIGIEYQRANSIEGSLRLHHDRIHQVEIWQRDWPRTGELNVDVQQNERLNNIDQRLIRCEEDVTNLKF